MDFGRPVSGSMLQNDGDRGNGGGNNMYLSYCTETVLYLYNNIYSFNKLLRDTKNEAGNT